MSCPRGFLAAAAAMSALVAAGPAPAIDMSLRPQFLPPLDGSSPAKALSLAAQGRDLIVAASPDDRAAATLRAHRARRLADGLWLVPGSESAAAVRRLRAIGDFRYAHPNGRLRRDSVNGDPIDPTPWWLPQIGASRLTAPPPGFPLTIVDDGIDTTHPEFASRRITFLNDHEVVRQDDFHGTMMASVAAAPLDGVGVAGVYPQANLRIADTGEGNCASILTAVHAAVSHSPSVINMSWGFSPPTCLAIYDELLRGVAAGSLPVSATGNMRLHYTLPSVPAIWPHVITAGSTGLAGRVSYFSSEGMGIDLAAPGESIMAATPTWFEPSGYAELEGTSFSAAIVSAASAWIATRRPMHVTQLTELLRATARNVGTPGWDKDTGYGILDISAALRRPLPAVDALEPNDDVNQVKAGGVFKDAAAPLTRPGLERASVRARLDRREDPVDVYRVYVPGQRVVRFRLVPSSNVDLEVFRANAHSCYYKSRRQALREILIGGGYRAGRATETYELRNKRSGGRYYYACAYKPRDVLQTASYSLTLTTEPAE
jgi:subtilase family protein